MGWEDPLEKEMATNSSVLAWEIPWTEEPGGLQSMRSKKSRTRTGMCVHTHMWVQGYTPKLVTLMPVNMTLFGKRVFADVIS